MLVRYGCCGHAAAASGANRRAAPVNGAPMSAEDAAANSSGPGAAAGSWVPPYDADRRGCQHAAQQFIDRGFCNADMVRWVLRAWRQQIFERSLSSQFDCMSRPSFSAGAPVGCSMGKWSFFGHEGACVTFIRLGLVMLLPWGGQLAGRLRAPPGPAETGCNPLPHVRTAISERTIARAAAAIVSAFEAFRARS